MSPAPLYLSQMLFLNLVPWVEIYATMYLFMVYQYNLCDEIGNLDCFGRSTMPLVYCSLLLYGWCQSD